MADQKTTENVHRNASIRTSTPSNIQSTEPILKYIKLEFIDLNDDFLSTISVSDKFLAIGFILFIFRTHSGNILITDLIGNKIKTFTQQVKINQISIDSSGEFIASASDDGSVAVNALYTTESLIIYNKRAVKSVQLELNYSKSLSKQICYGGMGEELIISSKGWFKNNNHIIDSEKGPIYTIKWKGQFIAWANENVL